MTSSCSYRRPKEASGGTNRFYLSINDQQYYYENLEGNGTDNNGKVTVQNNGDTGQRYGRPPDNRRK